MRHVLKVSGFTVALVLSLLLGTGSAAPVSALSGSEFKPGQIIDDALFYDGTTMTASQIQAFLDAKIPACDTQGSTGPYWDKHGNRWNTRAD